MQLAAQQAWTFKLLKISREIEPSSRKPTCEVILDSCRKDLRGTSGSRLFRWIGQTWPCELCLWCLAKLKVNSAELSQSKLAQMLLEVAPLCDGVVVASALRRRVSEQILPWLRLHGVFLLSSIVLQLLPTSWSLLFLLSPQSGQKFARASLIDSLIFPFLQKPWES